MEEEERASETLHHEVLLTDLTRSMQPFLFRTLRPDRMTYAVLGFIEEKLGSKYISGSNVPFSESFKESGSSTPMFFILSPGVDPLKDVEVLGRTLGYTASNKNFHNISLGQGQEKVAEEAMERASKHGHWVVLQNIHLVKVWLPRLEKKIEEQMEEAHKDYRLFLSADPAPTPASHIIPDTILETSIKITNEPPSGIFANLHKALDNFTQETLETCSKVIANCQCFEINLLSRRQSSSLFYSPFATSMQWYRNERSLGHRAGTRLTHTTQETLSSPAMSFTTTWRQTTGFHGRTYSIYLVRSCTAAISLMTGTDVCAR